MATKTTKNETTLKFYKLHPNAKDPLYATEGSACFDIHACFDGVEKYQIRQDTLNRVIEKPFKNGVLQINNMERVMIPTGLIFDIPTGHSVRLYPRSSLALKQGLTLANNVGIIDSDYVEPVYMMVCNISGYQQFVFDGNRICQAELVNELSYMIMETDVRPEQKTDRDGGFGSTGKD